MAIIMVPVFTRDLPGEVITMGIIITDMITIIRVHRLYIPLHLAHLIVHQGPPRIADDKEKALLRLYFESIFQVIFRYIHV